MNYLISTGFEALIGAKRLDSFNCHPNPVYGLDSSLNISYLNPAWFIFAEKNGSNKFIIDEWSLGRNIFDCIPDVFESFYRDLYNSALNEEKPTVSPKQREYECSSPELYRRFSMHLYHLKRDGLVIVNSLVVEEKHTSLPIDRQNIFNEDNYIDKHGLIHQCANCRRIQRQSNLEHWDWLPKYIEEPHPNTSHGVCMPCLRHYYSKK